MSTRKSTILERKLRVRGKHFEKFEKLCGVGGADVSCGATLSSARGQSTFRTVKINLATHNIGQATPVTAI